MGKNKDRDVKLKKRERPDDLDWLLERKRKKGKKGKRKTKAVEALEAAGPREKKKRGKVVPRANDPTALDTPDVRIKLNEPADDVDASAAAPRLVVEIGQIERDGQVRVRFDWNPEFINQLRNRGFSEPQEEEAVMSFLNWMFIVRLSDTPDAAIENVMIPELREALERGVSKNGTLLT